MAYTSVYAIKFSVYLIKTYSFKKISAAAKFLVYCQGNFPFRKPFSVWKLIKILKRWKCQTNIFNTLARMASGYYSFSGGVNKK